MMKLNEMQDRIYSKEEIDKINKYFLKSKNISELLNAYCVKYIKKFPERKEFIELNDNEYVFNLIEDSNFFVNKALNDLVLFEFGTMNHDNEITYPGRLFLNNAISSLIICWERITNILSIIYEIEYDKINLRNNSFNRLHKKLISNESFKKSNIYGKVCNLRSNHIFHIINDISVANRHRISKHLIQISRLDKEKKENPNYNFDIEFIPIVTIILDNIDLIYEILEMMICEFEDFVINKSKVVHVVQKLNFKDDYDLIIRELELQGQIRQSVELVNLSNDARELLRELVNKFELDAKNEIHTYLIDIIFRLLEGCKCLKDVANCINGTINRYYPFPAFIINIQYFTYESIFIICSCYDKLGSLIANFLNFDIKNKQNYFKCIIKKLTEIEQSNEQYKDFISMLTKLLGNKDFVDLSRYRNEIFHHIRPGAFYGKEGQEVYEIRLSYLVYRNLLILEQLLKEFLKIYK
ncbi:hypothetical protein CDLVIII_0526 [Clostridium sp. DL-VIII]|uniref:Cthe_2314 family HEPN domain-containing protein n=1 Tax=Clostridium sp. DL-VIII TaxID=641107 RepID=UPI00023AF4D9|nr:Cthe_2314 family HEPN domain-containing protein [Clostridium sp. DL-VIII]EHI97261.1 hypothetical protein CDLVIII_0526 [Clostridium sp. DL-VIII]